MNHFLVILFVVIMIAISYFLRHKLSDKYEEVYSTAITILSIFLGVFAGLSVNDFYAAKEEKKEILNYIDSSLADIDLTRDGISGYLNTSVYPSDSMILDVIKINGLNKMVVFDNILVNPSFQQKVCFSTLGNSIFLKHEIERMKTALLNIDGSLNVTEILNVYLELHGKLISTLMIEREKITKDLSCEWVNKEQLETINVIKID